MSSSKVIVYGDSMHFTFSLMKRTLCGLPLDGQHYFTNKPSIVSCSICDDRYMRPRHFVKKLDKKKALCGTRERDRRTTVVEETTCIECLYELRIRDIE